MATKNKSSATHAKDFVKKCAKVLRFQGIFFSPEITYLDNRFEQVIKI